MGRPGRAWDWFHFLWFGFEFLDKVRCVGLVLLLGLGRIFEGVGDSALLASGFDAHSWRVHISPGTKEEVIIIDVGQERG